METDPAALGEFCDSAQRTLFRLETLPRYADSSDGSDYQRYIRGEPGPDPERKAAWHKVLQADLDRGVTTRRVRVIHNPPTDYELYSCEWGYAQNIAWEDIRVAEIGARPGVTLLDDTADFWLADGQRAAIMFYSDAGAYLGFREAGRVEAEQYAAIADVARELSVPFAAWWDDHRQLWRGNRAA